VIALKNQYWRRTVLPVVAATAGLLVLSGSVLATDQSQQRQQGRDVNQAAKQQSRSTKVDCRQENQKSNSQCRQDKRDTKQEGRQEKRDIKY
jgi:Flp pilus assembly protein TadB